MESKCLIGYKVLETSPEGVPTRVEVGTVVDGKISSPMELPAGMDPIAIIKAAAEAARERKVPLAVWKDDKYVEIEFAPES